MIKYGMYFYDANGPKTGLSPEILKWAYADGTSPGAFPTINEITEVDGMYYFEWLPLQEIFILVDSKDTSMAPQFRYIPMVIYPERNFNVEGL